MRELVQLSDSMRRGHRSLRCVCALFWPSVRILVLVQHVPLGSMPRMWPGTLPKPTSSASADDAKLAAVAVDASAWLPTSASSAAAWVVPATSVYASLASAAFAASATTAILADAFANTTFAAALA